MNSMTRREVCDATSVSRRALQGYEKAGLVSAYDTNERGYLLYDEEAKKRIEQIKLFQEFGFTIKEIGEIIDAPAEILKSALEDKICNMYKESKKIETLIIKAGELKEELG